MKETKSELYKGVYHRRDGNREYWYMRTSENSRTCKTEREAAIAYDKHLIENGKEPVNILKRL